MIEIKITKGQFAFIDDEMFDRVSYFKWHAHPDRDTFYAGTNISMGNGKQKIIKLHQLIMGFPNGQIDHRDGCGLNNQLSNLRIATQSENMRNRKKFNASNTYRGVSWNKHSRKWCTRIRDVNGKEKNVGFFNDELVAAFAYDIAAIEHYGEFARLNIDIYNKLQV